MRCLFSLLLLFQSSIAVANNQQFEWLLEAIWQTELVNDPVLASSQGDTRYNDRLVDMRPSALAQRDRQYRDFLSQLDQVDPKSLTRSEQITLKMQRYRLQNYVDKYAFQAHLFPITSETGFHVKIASLPRLVHFKSAKDYRHYLARLASVPAYFEQQISWMRKGIEQGMVQPKIVLTGFEDSIAAYIKENAQDSGFYRPFKHMVTSVPSAEQDILRAQAKDLISRKVIPAYQYFYDFMVEQYIPNAKTNIAAKSWTNGLAYYQNRSEYYTTTQLNADEIHRIGLSEVSRIRTAMQKVIESVEFDGDIAGFIQFLRTDPKFYATSAAQLIERASYLSKQMDAKLPQLFYKLPRTPYGVAPVPSDIAPKYTTGRYIAPKRDDQPGYYWVNTYALDKRPLYALPALTLHEAVPGHHLQISLAREMDDLPPVRRYTYLSAFGEGWGLYSEYLGKEVGMYKTPYDEFGRLSYEMWRACRLVVDTGMHVKGWTRQQALDYMAEHTALSEHNIRTEVDRYISWPAQALSYKLGELTIKRLRKQAKSALKNNFDLRAFHDALLAHGSVPLSVLEENIAIFIQNAN